MEGQNKPVTVTFSDGTVKQIVFDSFETPEEGQIVLKGHLVDLHTENEIAGPIESSNEVLEENRSYMRSYIFRSALVRFLYEGRLCTAAVTHCTDKAWRVINKEFGVAWLPKNIIRWSEIAQQFCVIDERYQIDFTTNVKRGMDEYPCIFDPDDLVANELDC